MVKKSSRASDPDDSSHSSSISSSHNVADETEPQMPSTTLEDIEWTGILDSIPKKGSERSLASGTNSSGMSPSDLSLTTVMDRCEICAELMNRGYDIRLGETGRATLKKEISKILKNNGPLRELCLNKICRLKNANVLQLIQMAEISGCLPLALQISAEYWKDYNRKQMSGTTLGGSRKQRAKNDLSEERIPLSSSRSAPSHSNPQAPKGCVPAIPGLAPAPSVYNRLIDLEFADSLSCFSSPENNLDGDEANSESQGNGKWHREGGSKALDDRTPHKVVNVRRGLEERVGSGRRLKRACPTSDHLEKEVKTQEVCNGIEVYEMPNVKRFASELSLSRMSTTESMSLGEIGTVPTSEECDWNGGGEEEIESAMDEGKISKRVVAVEDNGTLWKMTISCKRRLYHPSRPELAS